MKIFNNIGNEVLDVQVDDNSYRHRAIMGDHSLTLYFSLPEHVEIPVGSYCDYQNERFTLERPEALKMKHSRLFEYTVILEAPEAKAKIWKFRNTVDGRLKFSLTAKPVEHLQMFVANMNRRDTGWTVGDCIDGVERLISYDHAFCSDALAQMASEFKTEYEISGKRVSLRKVEYNKNNPLPLSYGRGNGFKSGVGRSNTGDTQPIEILLVQGGSENLDPSKYGSPELLLPKSQTLSFDGEHFEGEEGFNQTSARQYVSSADGLSINRNDRQLSSLAEDSLDCSSISPKRVGTVSQVVTVDAEKNFYDIVDSSIHANLNFENYLIAGENMTVIFQSGMLAGRGEFEVKYYHNAVTKGNKAARRFEIVPKDVDGQTMPNATYKPAAGDKYAVFKCMLPDAYICDNQTKSGASWDMFREAVRFLFDNEEQKFSFSGELDGIWSKKDWVNIGGRIVLGGFILFSDTRFQPDGVLVRITGIKDYVNKPYSPVIELSNSTVTGGVSSTLKELGSQEVLIEDYHRDAIQFTKRRFRDARETISMLEEALLDNFTNSINPIAVQTMSLLVGDESLQFRFVKSLTNLTQINDTIAWNNEDKQLSIGESFIQHLTLGIKTISSSHSGEYKVWSLPAYTSAVLSEGEKKYYLYAKCSKTAQTGSFILSETAIKIEQVSGFYHLLVGVLNSEYDGERSFASLYGFTEVLPGRITTDKIVSSDGKTYFDLVNSIISGNIRFRSSDGSEMDMSEYYSDYIKAIDGLQSQIDGTIESFFKEYDPTTSNSPASEWSSYTEKEKHLNDTFTNLKSGRSWRWTKSGGNYSWTEILDTATVDALYRAEKAQDTADGKRRVFVNTPYPPYDIGDLWVQGSDGDIMRCKTSKGVGGSYSASDWIKASKYTDDSALSEFKNGDFQTLKNEAVKKETIIEGGYIKTSLINVDDIIVKNIYSKNGKFKTLDDGTMYAEGGVFGGYLQTPFVELDDSDAVYSNGSYLLRNNLNVMGSHCSVILPNNKSYIGKRIIIYNNCFIYTRAGDWTTQVSVQGGAPIYGTLTRDEMSASSTKTNPTSISYASYLFEFIGIPEPLSYADGEAVGSKCGWMITNYNKDVCY